MALRAGVIGYGLAGKVFHAPLLAAAGFAVAAIATSRAAEVRADWPSAEVEADPIRLAARGDLDLVVVASPHDSHAALARAALLAGRHVVVDKPLALSSREADGLVALARERGRLLTVFHNRRWDSDFLTIRAALADGLVGEPASYQAAWNRYRPAVRDRWREGAGPAAGLLWDLGPHLIDQAVSLFGRPDWLFADLAAQRAGAAAGADDSFHLVLGKGKLRIVLSATMLAAEPGPRHVLHGQHGSLVKAGMDVQEDQLRQGLRPGDAGFGEEPPDQQARLTEADGSTRALPTRRGEWPRFYTALREAIRAGGPLPVTPEEARDVIRLIELARDSHREGRRIDLDGLAGERGLG